MVKRDDLIQFIYQAIGHDLIQKARQKDERANGVQILGSQKVNKVALGVSLNEDFLKEAVAAKANFCIFHHGLDVSAFKSLVPLSAQKRLKLIFENNLTIAGFHYALDAHPTLGNNAVIIKELGAKRLNTPYFEEWGWVAEFNLAQDVKELADKCSKITSHDVFAVYGGKSKVKRIGVCSGGAKPLGETLFEIAEKNIELHISGEIAEGGPALAKDTRYNYFACGHYATEVFGVQELGKAIKSHFKNKLEVEFIDIPNPI